MQALFERQLFASYASGPGGLARAGKYGDIRLACPYGDVWAGLHAISRAQFGRNVGLCWSARFVLCKSLSEADEIGSADSQSPVLATTWHAQAVRVVAALT
jgi:hypothetical protein